MPKGERHARGDPYLFRSTRPLRDYTDSRQSKKRNARARASSWNGAMPIDHAMDARQMLRILGTVASFQGLVVDHGPSSRQDNSITLSYLYIPSYLTILL